MKRRIDWSAQALGTVPDSVIARAVGCSVQAVSQARKRLNIPAFVRPAVDWDAQPLGKVDDVELAARLGTTLAAVHNARFRRKIPALRHVENLRKAALLDSFRLELFHRRYEMTANEIGEMLGVDPKVVYRRLVRLGLQRSREEIMESPRTRMRISEAQRRAARERQMAQKGATE